MFARSIFRPLSSGCSALSAVLLLALFAAPAPANALSLYSDYIYTSEVTYCSSGRAVEVERFDIRYYRNNQSIGFDIDARSTAPNLNADLNIQLFAYGKSYLNLTANICNVLAGALCPLPQYQFDGSFAYILPSTVNIKLPAIAFSVPDLDAYAQIILTDQQTGEEALCLGATLSNGKTVYDSRVGWAIGGLTIAAFVAALIHSFFPISPYKSGPEWRFATILTYFQHVALCGFLSLDYPVVYKNFTLNFAWAQGLIYMQPINAAINRMRLKTGGVDRTGQTYTVIAENAVQLARTSSNALDTSRNPRSFARASAYTVPTVGQAPSYNLISGIETTAQDLDITYPNAFMTVFIVFLLLCAVMVAICLLATAGVLIYSLVQKRKNGNSTSARQNLRYFIWTNFLRIFLVAYTPIILFVFWQFLHEADSGWLAVFIAALTFVLIHVAIFGIYWHISKIAHRALNNGSQEKLSLRWSTVSSQFKRSGQGYLLLLAAASFVGAAFVAFAQGHGLVQLIPLIVIEVVVFLAFCIWRPFANRGSNVLMIFISLFKILAYGLLIAFYTHLTYNGIIKAVLGFVLIAVQGIMTIVLFIVTVYNLFTGIIWGRKARREAIAENQAMMEKERPVGPFLSQRPSYLARNGTGYASVAPRSPSEEHDDTMQPPPVSNLYAPGRPDSADTANFQNEEGNRPYDSRPQSGITDDNRTVVAESSNEENQVYGEKAPQSGSRFNPKFWKRGGNDDNV